MRAYRPGFYPVRFVSSPYEHTAKRVWFEQVFFPRRNDIVSVNPVDAFIELVDEIITETEKLEMPVF